MIPERPLLMPEAEPGRTARDDGELTRLIRAERIRMLFAPTVPVCTVSALVAMGLAGLLVNAGVGRVAWAWALATVLAAMLPLVLLRAFLKSADKSHPRWLLGLAWACTAHGSAWGLAGFITPQTDMVMTAVTVATLVGATAVCSLALQADLRVNLSINLPMLIPSVVALAARLDSYGWFGAAGLMAMLGLLVLEGRRADRRIAELLWLRFTTDRIARERAEALKLAQRHSAVKDQFLATMSHEMRTPLHGILGLSRLVHGRLPDRAGVLRDARHQLGLIERTGEHLLGIINDVLDFSRIEAGKLTIEPQPFELCALLRDVRALQGVAAADKGLQLRVEVELPEPCWVQGDAARLRQVLINLLGNAIKFTDEGRVGLKVWRLPPPRDGEGAPRIAFEVSDTGPGIAPAQLPRVFDAFHQVDGGFNRRHRGTGLGLTISREIARAMGGDIVADSTLGQGSLFTLAVPLPAADPQSVPLTPPRPVRESPSQFGTLANEVDAALMLSDEGAAPPPVRGHVLMAEDNAVNALVAEATLANLGLAVTRVEDGQQALQALCRRDRAYDLVLMDCQMPVMDGLEATRRLRAWEEEQGLPPIAVIALTANALAGDRERCLAAGMSGHLAKPFRQEELMAMLSPHLG